MGGNRTGAMFNSAGNEEMCPLCERPLTKQESKKPIQNATQTAADTIASLVERGALVGESRLTVGRPSNPTDGSCAVAVDLNVSPEEEDTAAASKKLDMAENATMKEDYVEHCDDTSPISTPEQPTTNTTSSKDSDEHHIGTIKGSTLEQLPTGNEPVAENVLPQDNVAADLSEKLDMAEPTTIMNEDSVEPGDDTSPISTPEHATTDTISSKDSADHDIETATVSTLEQRFSPQVPSEDKV